MKGVKSGGENRWEGVEWGESGEMGVKVVKWSESGELGERGEMG